MYVLIIIGKKNLNTLILLHIRQYVVDHGIKESKLRSMIKYCQIMALLVY